MLRLPGAAAPLGASERYALELLADLGRLVPVDDPAADVVKVEVAEGPGEPGSLAAAAARGWDLTVRDGAVAVPRSVLRLLAGVATARSERQSEARDRYGRVPPAANALARGWQGTRRIPRCSRPALRPSCGGRAACVSRDAVARGGAGRGDHPPDIASWWPLFTGLRVAELAGKGELGLTLRVLGAAAGAVAGDPVTAGAAALLEDESARGIAATWFVICGTPTMATFAAGDITYLPEARRPSGIVRAALAAGHALGLHGSFATMDSKGEFAAQRRRLEAIAARPAAGVRQHFLRFRPFATHRAMAEAGFSYDTRTALRQRVSPRVADAVHRRAASAGRGAGA
jgi:hypothetical protein